MNKDDPNYSFYQKWGNDMVILIEKYEKLGMNDYFLLDCHISFLITGIASICKNEKQFQEAADEIIAHIKQAVFKDK